MRSTIILLAPFFIIFIQSRSTKFVQYCIGDTQCGPGEQCFPDATGLLICQQISEQITTTSLPKQIVCANDVPCGTFGKCMHFSWPGPCQYGLNTKSKNFGLINDQCYNDADCAQYLRCVAENGIKTCQVIPGMLPYKTCKSNADCDIIQICSFSTEYNANLCLGYPEYRTVQIGQFWNGNIGNNQISSNQINNGAFSKDLEKQCTADYQCSIFEICAEKTIPGNRICIYNPTASNRQCRFNADCQSGQHCEKVLELLYICKPAKQTTFMQPCSYDYECSGDQRCIDINKDHSIHQNTRYCLSFDGTSAV